MSFNIIAIEPFDKQLKRLCKKHISLKKDVTELEEQLSKNPFIGSSIGSGCYKIRLAITSKGKGKSGGARIITHVFIQKNIVYLIADPMFRRGAIAKPRRCLHDTRALDRRPADFGEGCPIGVGPLCRAGAVAAGAPGAAGGAGARCAGDARVWLVGAQGRVPARPGSALRRRQGARAPMAADGR